MKPELLAPAGDHECLIAAIENGADAVYFGVRGHNARARAANFEVATIADQIGLLHQRGVRGYVTLNTLVFPNELADVETLVRAVAEAGVDALIVQDIGVCRLVREIAPDLEIHASTQMSVSSAAGVRMAEELGCSRVILARELSIEEIARIRAEATLPLEVFVHGALCVAYSGQCLTSESLGARSANRGECAQACRMPYSIVCDGSDVDLDDVQYLLSPQDLAAYDLVPKLCELGISSLKIEGRLKSPEYVASITRQYRRAIDAACAGLDPDFSSADIDEMKLMFSRGFSHGFLDGNDHKVLVRGDYAKKRGLPIGRVEAVTGRRVRVRTDVAVKPGDGVVFDAVEHLSAPEQGGRVYEVRGSAPILELGFDSNAIDLGQIMPGQQLWKTDDPSVTKRLRATYQGKPRRLVDVDVTIHAEAGACLAITARTADGRCAAETSAESLSEARTQPATLKTLQAQFDRLGGTVYRLNRFEAVIQGAPNVPASVLNGVRRSLIGKLDALANGAGPRALAEERALERLRPVRTEPASCAPSLSALCRDTEQALAAVSTGVKTIYLDYQHIKQYAEAVEAVRSAQRDVRVFIAPPRIEKPGEAPIFAFLEKAGADGMLVRNAGSLEYCAARRMPFVVDFSLNAANELSCAWLKSKGAMRVTASYDLSAEQLGDLARSTPSDWLEIVLHQHMPMFHMEHCVFCAFLSPGHDKTDCGRPCDLHRVSLRDRVGMEHPLVADVGCRNTLFNAVPQTAAEYLPELLRLGIRQLRVEFLNDSAADVSRTLSLYTEALRGVRPAHSLWRSLKATSRYGVTRGALAVIQ